MGSAYSSYRYHTDVHGADCPRFEGDRRAVYARRWGDIEASTRYWKEDNGHTEVWRMKYQNIQNEKHTCVLDIKAAYDFYNDLENVYFGFIDSSAGDETKLGLKITRVTRNGLSGEITSISSSSGAAPVSYPGPTIGFSTETITIVSYSCSQRDGEFVLELNKLLDQHAYRVTLHHYYVNKDVGLYVKVRIGRNRRGFDVEVEGPFNLWSVHRRWTWRRPNDGAKASEGNKSGASNNNSSLKLQSNDHDGEDIAGQVVKQPSFSSEIREQYYKGLINLSGTAGPLSGSIFVNCHF